MSELFQSMQECVQEACEQGHVPEGLLVKLSGMIGDAYNGVTGVANVAQENGAQGVGFATLVKGPEAAGYPRFTEMLLNADFCTALVVYKVEALRIERGNPASSAYLDAHEIRRLESWGAELVNGAMRAWSSFFTADAPGFVFTERAPVAVALSERTIPKKFQSMVCNLVAMEINLWPQIKRFLDLWRITGAKLFPPACWDDVYLNVIMVTEPRMVAFVVDAGDLDMNKLSELGPVRRSQSSYIDNAMVRLSGKQRELIQDAVTDIQTRHNGHFFKQVPMAPWCALHFKYPRLTNPELHELLGNPLGQSFWTVLDLDGQ